MKTLRKRNITYKKRKGNRKSRNQRGNKRKTKKGGTGWLPRFTGKAIRADCGEWPILEVFHQINKVKRHQTNKNQAKEVEHKKRLFAALNEVHCDNIQYLKDMGEYLQSQKGGWPKARDESPYGILPGNVAEMKALYERPTTKPVQDNIPPPVVVVKEEIGVDVVNDYEANAELLNTYTAYLVGLKEKCTKELFLGVTDKETHVKELIRFLTKKESRLLDEYMATQQYKSGCEGKAKEVALKLNKLKSVGKPGNKNWMFTRHGPSCNNIVGMTGKTMEPNLTDAGIHRLIQHKNNNSVMFTSNYVFVSPLIRTWMTAIILYGVNNNQPLHLFISPFLKEHFKSGFKNGNFPIQLNEQIERIKDFLRHLNTMETIQLTQTIVIQFPTASNSIASITINTRTQETEGNVNIDLYGLNYLTQYWLPSLQGVRTRNAAFILSICSLN